MNEKLFEILERIATALEIIAYSLSKDINKKENQNISKNRLGEVLQSASLYEEKDRVGNEVIKNRQLFIESFLSDCKITIKNILPKDENDEVLNKIAVFMGNRYSLIKPFLEQIKAKMNSAGTIKMELKKYTQEQISSICQLAKKLYEIAFLEQYIYLKSPKYLLFATPSRIPQSINFLSGKWLERYILSQIISLINQVNGTIEFSYILNPQIKLPNGNDFELDLLFEINEEIFWFEAKTGDYQRYVKKYSEVSKILNLDVNHSFMILTDISKEGAQALKSLFGMNVVCVENFSEEFLKSIIKYSNLNTAEEDNFQNSLSNTEQRC